MLSVLQPFSRADWRLILWFLIYEERLGEWVYSAEYICSLVKRMDRRIIYGLINGILLLFDEIKREEIERGGGFRA